MTAFRAPRKDAATDATGSPADWTGTTEMTKRIKIAHLPGNKGAVVNRKGRITLAKVGKKHHV